MNYKLCIFCQARLPYDLYVARCIPCRADFAYDKSDYKYMTQIFTYINNTEYLVRYLHYANKILIMNRINPYQFDCITEIETELYFTPSNIQEKLKKILVML